MATRAQRARSGRPASAGQVFLVDDESSVRRAFTRLLQSAGFSVSSFGTAEEFLAAGPYDSGGCVVADLRMPGLSGLELQDRVAERGIDLPIVFVSGRADLGSGIQAMKGGAVDFLEKPVSDHDLIDAIRRALAEGERRRARREERELLEARLSKLTPREREVCSLIVLGLLNKQVGAELGASEKTIKVHRARVMEKMQAGSLAELVRMSDKVGLRARGLHRGPLRPGPPTEAQ